MTPKQKREHAAKLSALKAREQVLLAEAQAAFAALERANEAHRAAQRALSSIRHEIADHEVMPLVDSLSPYLRSQLGLPQAARDSEAVTELTGLGLLAPPQAGRFTHFTPEGLRVFHLLLKQEL